MQPPKLRKRIEAVSIEYEALPSIHTIEIASSKCTIIWGTGQYF